MSKYFPQMKDEINLSSLCDYLGIDQGGNILLQVEYILETMKKRLAEDFHLKNMDRSDSYIYSDSIKHICRLILFYIGSLAEETSEEELISQVYPLEYYFDRNIETDSDTRPIKDYLGYQYKFRYYWNDLRNITLHQEPKCQEECVINGLIYQRKRNFLLAKEMYQKANAKEALRNLEFVERTYYPEPKYLNQNDMKYYVLFNRKDKEVLYQLGRTNYYGIGQERNKELGLSYFYAASALGHEKASLEIKKIKGK